MVGLLEACSRYDSIPGWLEIDEAEYLYQAASQVSSGVIVEVGSANGRSTVALSLGAQAGAGAKLFAIEPHEPFVGIYGGHFGPQNRRTFLETMLGFDGWKNTRLINLSSEVVCPGWQLPVGLLWLDGDHRYEAVRRDFDLWSLHLVPGALVVLHDGLDADGGPHRLASECLASGFFRTMPAAGTMVALIRH